MTSTNFIVAEERFNAGLVADRQSRYAEAASLYRQAITLSPTVAKYHNELGVVCARLNLPKDALSGFERAIALDPTFADAYNNKSVLLLSQGKIADAMAAALEALRLRPDFALAHCSAGNAHAANSSLGDAIAAYKQALAIWPDYLNAWINLGKVQFTSRRFDEATISFKSALRYQPEHAELLAYLGICYFNVGDLVNAQPPLLRVVTLQPQNFTALLLLGWCLRASEPTKAQSYFQRALAISPNDAEAKYGLACALINAGQVILAREHLCTLVAKNHANSEYFSTFLAMNQYLPAQTQSQAFAEYREFARRFEEPWKRVRHTYKNRRDPYKRLRVGYVSADFRNHPIGYFVLPAIEQHNRQEVEVYCYDTSASGDALTVRFRAASDEWRACYGMTDDALAKLIQSDAIDILVELAGHSTYNRLTLFARKPAPIQYSWVGYLGTTGLTSIDYRLTDAVLDPIGLTDVHHSEQLVRLPSGWAPYRPPDLPLEPNELPRANAGVFTFGSLNAPFKLNSDVLALWAKILARCPQSRLLLGNMYELQTEERLRSELESRGVNATRLVFQRKLPMVEYLKLHHSIDLALDTFPHNGGTTTNHSLWMGVPVLTLAGNRTSARIAATLLHQVSLDEFVANAPEEYVEKAVALYQSTERLATVRRELRGRVMENVRHRNPAIVREVEAEYRRAWVKWCESA
jgi:protein O-GlcNAc transferase